MRKKRIDTTPIKLEWGASDFLFEAQTLAATGEVRERYLLHNPADVEKEEDIEYLEKLWELYFPANQPWTCEEEAYLSVMRESIEKRLSELSL